MVEDSEKGLKPQCVMKAVPPIWRGDSAHLFPGLYPGISTDTLKSSQCRIYTREISKYWACKMAQQVKVLGLQAQQPEFDSRNPHKGGRGELTSQNCPLASTRVAWHAQTAVHTTQHVQQMNIHTMMMIMMVVVVVIYKKKKIMLQLREFFSFPQRAEYISLSSRSFSFCGLVKLRMAFWKMRPET